MDLAIVAVLAVGASALATGSIASITAYPPIPVDNPFESVIDISPGLCSSAEGSKVFTNYTARNKTPFGAEVRIGGLGGSLPETITIEPHGSRDGTAFVPYGPRGPFGSACGITVIDAKLNVTSKDVIDLYTKTQELEIKIQRLENNSPSIFYGNVFEGKNESGMADVKIIVVNVADHTEIHRTTTDSYGAFAVWVNPGGYLIQAIGGGPNSYKYTTISEPTRIDLKYD